MTGEALRDLRQQAGLSRRALGALAGVSAGTVGRWERTSPPPGRTERLRRLLAAPEDARMMLSALALAEEAAAEGEVPVGCVIARDGVVVGRGRNRREGARSALAHAELEAIDQACRTLGGWRLWQCTLYVTLEPCPMCAGAILNARIPRVVYGARDPKAGSCGSVCDLFCMAYNHHPRAEQGLLEDACGAALRRFFRDLRARRRKDGETP